MQLTGRCYCGDLRYLAAGEARFRIQCHCRECQYISGGSPNVVLGMPAETFGYAQGRPRAFTRGDLPAPVTREFCERCGTHILTRSPRLPDAVLIKVGTLDDPSVFGLPGMAIFICDQQAFHRIPEGVPAHDKRPGSYAPAEASR